MLRELRTVAFSVSGTILFIGICIVGLYYFDLGKYVLTDQQSRSSADIKAASLAQQPTEALFLSSIKSLPSETNEWWAARSDHRLVAHAIWLCKTGESEGLDNLSREHFNALLLNLMPNGNHVFASEREIAQKASSNGPRSIVLSASDQTVLALSDSVARARLAAADGASSNVPWVQRLGLETLAVSALATLFVTLQGKMKSVELTDQERKDLNGKPAGERVSYCLFGPGSGFRWVAFWAVALSILGTSLTGLKQVYDPTRTLTQNTRALLDLRQLHQDIVLGIRCTDQQRVALSDRASQNWAKTIRRIRATIIPEYGAYASLDVGGSSQRPDPTDDEAVNREGASAPPAPSTVRQTTKD